jgi:hypothetical protein
MAVAAIAMKHLRRTAAAALAVAVACAAMGCDDREASRPRTAPATTRAVVASQAQPATARAEAATQPQPANAFVAIDGVPTEFPPARLRLTRTDEGVRALLFTDDPRSASAADYKGNSFYFDVPLKAVDPKDVHGAEYWYKAPVSEAEDDLPYGIFLGGIRGTHLQPQDVAFKFESVGDKVVIRLGGRFLVVNQEGKSIPGTFAGATGTLYTTVESKKD